MARGEEVGIMNDVISDPVHIEWKDPDSDWHWFYLLGTRGEWLKLQGRDSPDGSKHDGDVFWVHRSEMKSMEVEA